MKKASFALLLLAGLALSCSKEDLKINETKENNVEYSFNIAVSSIQGDTKAVKTDWEEGDIVNLWFDGATSEPQVVMTYTEGEWVSEQKDASLSLGATGKLTALYESGNDYSELGLSGMPLVVSSIGEEYQLNGSEVEATVDGWIFNTPYQIVVPGIETGFSGYLLYCKDLSAGSRIELKSSNGETKVSVTLDSFGKKIRGTVNEDGAAFYFTKSGTEKEKTFVFYLTHNEKRYSYTTKATTISGNRANKKLPTFSVDANGDPTEGCKWTRMDDEFVNLGLSVKWATCNVGAYNPEEYGNYYAWGETTIKDFYEWRTYKYCVYGGDEDPDLLTKYCYDSSEGYNGYTDDKTILDLSDDAAYVNWGEDWRIPTADEWNELLDIENCTWTKTTINSIVGYIVTSKINGNSIFLPCAGWKYDDPPYDRNGFGYYWSSTLYESYTFNAWYALLLGTKVGNYSRCRGMSIRPVRRY